MNAIFHNLTNAMALKSHTIVALAYIPYVHSNSLLAIRMGTYLVLVAISRKMQKSFYFCCRQGSSIQNGENACDAGQDRDSLCDAEDSISDRY